MIKTMIKNPEGIDLSLEQKILKIGKEIFKKVKSSKTSFFDRSFWSAKLMELAMKDEKLKVELFRFVDVLPTLKSDDKLNKHIKEYFKNIPEFSHIVKSLEAFHETPLLGLVGKKATSVAIKAGVTEIAKNFIAGENVKEVFFKISELRKKKLTFTVDILGEAVLSEKEANQYQKLYLDLILGLSNEVKAFQEIPILDNAPFGKLPRVNISVKPSSLYSQVDPMDFSNSVFHLKENLRPILSLAKEKNAFINLDMESYFYKDLTLLVFKEILAEAEFKNWQDVGIVIQAYLKDSENDLKDLIEWTKKRNKQITVRLVKGAYWDYETILSRQKNWRCPVFENKFETDANFEKLSKILLDNYPYIYTTIASHNIRSISFVKTYAQELGIPHDALEYQFLYGMADPIKEAMVESGERVRIYTPYGELIPGMAYLVRRLLENTANESFLRQGFQEGLNEEELLKPPTLKLQTMSCEPQNKNSQLSFVNVPDTDFTLKSDRELMKDALRKVKNELGTKYPLVIGGKKIETSEWADSINPSKPDEVIGKFALASKNDADEAVRVAKETFKDWSCTSIDKRIEILQKAAKLMEERRFELSAWMVYEEGKAWREADGDVSEAIDFLIYYSQCAKKLFTPEKLISPPGEENYSIYQGRGVAVIISPWNFPLAILTGMSSAALVCGNTVILKPAKQASIIAAKYMEILEQAGLPPGVCNYLPGDGKIIGNYLVCHKDVNIIAFTGSMEVGLSINKLAQEIQPGQHFVKKVICEMGGKNAIIIDDDADLDEAVKGVIYSAFGYSGQKCSAASRVIVLKDIYDHFIERLVEAAKSIKLGDPSCPSSYLGPVIDKSAYESIKRYIEIGKEEGKILTGAEVLRCVGAEEGYFIPPSIFTNVNPNAKIAQEEIFGPVLAVVKVNDFNEALEVACQVKFALTGGLFSRSPENIQAAKEKFKVGNLYINRACTGAKVGRQPFGGFKMSGIGSKAGGKDYLLQFVEPRVITENSMRRGFAPE